MHPEKTKEMIRFAYQEGIATGTELISGLPGETYQSFRDGFMKAIDLGFDSIYMGNLYLIKGSELYSRQSRKNFGLKTVYSLIGKDVTEVGDRYTFEADEIVTESNTMTRTDFWGLQKFMFFGHLCFNSGFLKEVIKFCSHYDISLPEVYDEIMKHQKQYPFINATVSNYLGQIKNMFFKNRDELVAAIKLNIKYSDNLDQLNPRRQLFLFMGRALGGINKINLIEEYIKACRAIYNTKNVDAKDDYFDSITTFLAKLTRDIIISPVEKIEGHVIVEAPYDVIAWEKDYYIRPLPVYKLTKPITLDLQVRNIGEHNDFFKKTAEWPDIEKYEYYFSMMVSSNQRRYITYAQ